ncbi:alpha-amylase family glycosyl hydrolase [Lentibacillus sp. N15]|uniref:alpha-amylase family glycosyl hydrolase n=1 Tax=Lentibacillus songyuanensis TaxID=3136161 RepID=UPI0031B9F23E
MKKVGLFVLIIPFFLCWTSSIHAEENGIEDEMIYSIFVDRFNNGDQQLGDQVDVDDPQAYHGGDIKGITDKLDYIKGLGFTTISLSSIMENAKGGYHGYWIDDFFKVEDQFGSINDLQTLVKEAHKRDLKVLLEFVPNYVASTHSFANDPNKTVPNNAKDAMWLDQAVQLNLENKEVKDMLLKAGDYWLEETDIDGYHLHAVDQIPTAFLQEFVDHVKRTKPDIYLTASVLRAEDLTQDAYDAGIPFIEDPTGQELMTDVFSHAGTPVEKLYRNWKASGKKSDLLTIDNKFTKRFTQDTVENERNPATTWKLVLAYLYTTPGIPEIYQGSEIPMDSPTIEKGQRLVEFNQSDQELGDFFNKMASLRSRFPALQDGDFELAGSNGAMSVFKRSDGKESLYIAINNDTSTKAVTVDDVPEGMQLTGLLGDNIVRKNDDGTYKIGIDRESVEVYVAEEDTGLNWLFIGMIVAVFVVFILGVVLLSRKQHKNKPIQG